MKRAVPLTVALAAATLGLTACGGDADGDRSARAETTPNTTSGEVPTSVAPTPTTPDAAATSPASTSPVTPADAPSPSGAAPDAASKAGQRPRSRPARIEADKTAMLNVRTMVSIIESCHSGRDTYKACNTHDELGDPSLLGLRIGKRRGEVQVSATDNGFRITGHSMSGAKFTVARGPGGDRFKCVQGRKPGACPDDRTWSF